VPPGTLAGELGALLQEPRAGSEPIWIDRDGRVDAAKLRWNTQRPSIATVVRWIAAPLTWRRFGPVRPRLRASARRTYDAAMCYAAPPARPQRSAELAGYVLQSSAPHTVPLYAASHPVTGDQLLSTSESEGRKLGYRDLTLVGHIVASAPVTGQLGPRRADAPWASRFGRVDGAT
jgi:hypothetical protein